MEQARRLVVVASQPLLQPVRAFNRVATGHALEEDDTLVQVDLTDHLRSISESECTPKARLELVADLDVVDTGVLLVVLHVGGVEALASCSAFANGRRQRLSCLRHK